MQTKGYPIGVEYITILLDRDVYHIFVPFLQDNSRGGSLHLYLVNGKDCRSFATQIIGIDPCNRIKWKHYKNEWMYHSMDDLSKPRQ